MKNKSIWTEVVDKGKIKSVSCDCEYDVVIIGGGITGLSTAYNFLTDDIRVCVVEANTIGLGITSKSTAKITYLQDGIYNKIASINGYETAKKYYESQHLAIDILKNTIENNNIDCDFQESDSYLIAKTKKQRQNLFKEKHLLKSFGEEMEEIDVLPDGLNVDGIVVHNTYVFHPLKYLFNLKKIISSKIPIYEKSRVMKISKKPGKYILYVNGFKLTCSQVIICTHYPYFLFPYLMPLKCSLEKSYIGVFENKDKNNFQAITSSDPTLSIRYINDNYKLILINSHNLVKNPSSSKYFDTLIKNDCKYIWSNMDIITKDYLPYIGLIDDFLYLATGFNTWGMTNGTLAGKIIYDLINHKENEYINLFSPKRGGYINLIKYPLYLFNNIYSFTKSYLVKQNNSNIKYRKINNTKVGIYTDDEGNKHIVKITCPHLGCRLKFNDVEKTWDCPCHGSRFDIDGNCLDGPSNYNISWK